MADKDLLYFNQSSGQWELVNAGAISNGTIVITPDQIGLLSGLSTTNKASLVAAINENKASLNQLPFQGGNQAVVQQSAIIAETDTRTVNVTRDATTGKITTVTEKDGATVVDSVTVTRDATTGKITSFTETVGGKTITYTLTRDANGRISTVPKTVV